MIYFTADQHFGHANVIKHCNRPFETVDEMDATLIRNWNDTVGINDEIYILGDLTMKSAADAHKYLSALNGRKYLIVGNHDRFLNRIDVFENHFEWVKDYFVLRQDGRMFVLFHYPIAEWNGYFRRSIHLYGHIHNSEASSVRMDNAALAFNVGVDCTDFRPVSIAEIIAMAEARMENQ